MTVNLKHGFGLFGQGDVVYPDSKAEGICEEDGSVHRVYRAVPDVEQRSCVVKAQVAARRDEKPQNLKENRPFYTLFLLHNTKIHPLSMCICSMTHPSNTSAWYGISSLE